jgi:polyphosphate kinase
MAAAESGKHVTALVELKARFDEANNVSWARQMERAGVHVVFGFLDLKTHCKVSMVVRQEGQQLRRYVHLGTGNYNPTTALSYTDVGLFTADESIAEDASALFNLLTGYSQGHAWQKLIVAPNDLHHRTIELIDEQAQRSRDGLPSRIFAKLNALVDHRVIEALYRASQAGVPIDIVSRGICCLRPGVPGLSETIRVRSIIDRFLEHSRIYVFGPDEEAHVFLSSADWMPRNFFRRVEVMFPVQVPELADRILKEIIPTYLADNTRARRLDPDGVFRLLKPAEGQSPRRCQHEFLEPRTVPAVELAEPSPA